MQFPKIPDSKEIADMVTEMTTKAMQPMMDELVLIRTSLERLLEIQSAAHGDPEENQLRVIHNL